MNKRLKERITSISRDQQEAAMVEQAVEQSNETRCRFCGRQMTKEDGFLKCENDDVVISKRVL